MLRRTAEYSNQQRDNCCPQQQQHEGVEDHKKGGDVHRGTSIITCSCRWVEATGIKYLFIYVKGNTLC